MYGGQVEKRLYQIVMLFVEGEVNQEKAFGVDPYVGRQLGHTGSHSQRWAISGKHKLNRLFHDRIRLFFKIRAIHPFTDFVESLAPGTDIDNLHG